MFRSGVLEKINPYLSENIEAIRYNEGKQDNFIVLNKNTLQEQQLAPDLQPMNYFQEDQQQEINQGDRIKFNPGPESNFDEEITGQVVSSYNKGEVEFITDDQDMKRVKLDNGEISKIKETVGEDLPIDISFNDFDFELARRAYDGSSFSPKKRASYDINRYLTHMQNVYNELEGLAKTKKQKSILKMELERYKKNYLDKLSSLLSSKARTASQFVTGPAKFDHRKNNKRMGTVDKKREGFLNWQDKALKAMKRKLKKSRSDKQVTNEEFESLKKDINSSMVSIAKVMNGQSPGMNKDAFKNSIIGKIKRRAKNGKVELVEKALEHLEKKQNELLPRNTITKRHSVWNALETAKSVAKKQNKSGVETIKEYESVEIVNDHGANRVRILFNEKPSKEVRNELKGSGWNWSPSVGAWQRKNTNAAKQNSKYIIDKFFEESNEIDESQEKTKEEISRKQNNTIDSLFDSAMGAVGKGEASWDNIEIFKAKNEPVVRFKMNKEDGTDITTTNKRSSDGSVYIDKKGNIIDIEKNPTVKENDYVKVEQKDIIREKSNKTETTRKLPQEITLDEFLKRNSEAGLGKEHHRANVRRALEAGEQVPQEVLNDYPELQENKKELTSSEKDRIKKAGEKAYNRIIKTEPGKTPNGYKTEEDIRKEAQREKKEAEEVMEQNIKEEKRKKEKRKADFIEERKRKEKAKSDKKNRVKGGDELESWARNSVEEIPRSVYIAYDLRTGQINQVLTDIKDGITNKENVKKVLDKALELNVIKDPKYKLYKQRIDSIKDTPKETNQQQEVLNDYPELQEKQGQETGNQKIETLTESATPKSQLFPTAIRLPNNEYVNIEYAVVEADNLIASHDSNLNKNENYLQDLQPRAREREASLSQIENIKNEFDPLSVMTSRSADGSPIISPDGMVEIGNGRTIAIKDMYKNNAETIQEYKDILIDEAGNLGLNQEQIEQADNPVLVRKRTDDMSLKEREQYVIEANKSDNADQSSTEMAMNDAKQMSSQLLSKYNSQSGINTLKNQDFVSNFLDDVVGEAGKGKYLDESGTISQDGLKRIENAIFAKVYGDLNAIKKLSERVDAKMKNVTGAMLNVAPDYLKMQESIKDGNLYDLDIAEDIADTFKLYEEAKKIGNPIEDFINQQKMFGPDTTALQEELIKMFERNKYSKKKMTEILGSYVDAVKEAGNPKQQTMFGKREAPNKKEVLEAAIKVAEEGENDQQQAFFAEKEQTVGSKNASTKSKTQAEKVQQQIKELQEKIKTETKDNKLDKFNNKLEALKKQLIKLHKGEGGYIDFGSLFGDNKEIEDVTDLFEQVRRKEKFEAGKDDWFGAKDLAEVEHSIEALQLEDKLKESLHGDLTANDINTAIQVSIDLKYTAATTNKTVQETIDKYYDQLSEEKQKYVDLSQNLTKEQQQIEEEILESDKTMGDKAKRAGVINNIVDYHLTRKWESDSKLDSQIEKKFGTKSALRKQRTLESILEGWAKGKELEIQGATKALQASKNNLVRTIEDKALVETLEKENVMKPEHKVTKEDLENGWEAIQHPNFREWKAVDNVELGKEIKIDSTDQADDFSIDDKVIAQDGKKEGEIGRIEVENRLNNVTVRFKDGGSYRYHLNDLKKIRPGGPNTFIADDGTVFERVDFYAPPGVAENLDNILSTPEKNDFRALAQARKQLILQSSFFHHLAYMRSFGLATDTSLFEALTTKNPIKMMNQGMELLKTMDSELELLISQGLTIGRVQDFDLKNYRGGDKDSKFWRLALGREGGFRQKHSDFLFKKMGAGLKAKAALMEYKYMLRKNPELAQSLKGRKKLAKNVAKLINQDFGGLHFERMGMSPKTEGTLDLIFLAKDWTLSNGLMVYNALPKWARKTIKSIGYPFKKGAASYRGEEVQKAVDPTEVKQALDNYLQQDDLSQEEKMKAEHTRKYFQEKIEDQQRQTKLSRHALFNVAIKSSVLSLMMNFAMAGLDSLDDDEFEPLRMYAKRFKSIKSTMSPAKKWQTMFDNLINSVALDITPIFEMAGIDTDNSRKYFSIAGHFEDPLELVANTAQFLKYKGSALTQISLDAITGTNWQGKAYTTYKEFLGTDDKGNYKTTNLKEGYVKGQNKGGKDQFKLTKWGFAPDTTTFDQAPSFIMSEALGSTPIQVQNAARLMMGESDWLEMTLESAGIGVRQVRKDNN